MPLGLGIPLAILFLHSVLPRQTMVCFRCVSQSNEPRALPPTQDTLWKLGLKVGELAFEDRLDS